MATIRSAQPQTHALPLTVLIGASAGGVEALNRILPQLPADYPAAVVVVLHQPSEGPSLLVEVFSPRVRLLTKEADEKEPLVAGVIYFAPPGYHLLIETDGTLALSVDDPVLFCRPAIDVLFDSAAQALGSKAIGVVLTGANEDGAAGLARVQQAGGSAVVQDPADALVATMPEAALAAVPTAQILTATAIGQWLATLQPGGRHGAQ
ncbi:chemotaxis protein CheB [Amantichitinum ursilacus]|uniref:protein-glutamate methylesterase n=1 Tax=Amantichitinum ursilacus TaxID=857265 RepID=A0A0N0XHZ0_9NEIS|nr:chemotaxis protein CheB [Amantichitinum ursilacus]KPC49091.1 Chemotaxis response regulator protein-glutamate methylesterase of group 1 operon [Amantichitinum ursilacus]